MLRIHSAASRDIEPTALNSDFGHSVTLGREGGVIFCATRGYIRRMVVHQDRKNMLSIVGDFQYYIDE